MGEAEGMPTRAPPDHRATCFNIHDITSSLGGPGPRGDEATRRQRHRKTTGNAPVRSLQPVTGSSPVSIRLRIPVFTKASHVVVFEPGRRASVKLRTKPRPRASLILLNEPNPS